MHKKEGRVPQNFNLVYIGELVFIAQNFNLVYIGELVFFEKFGI